MHDHFQWDASSHAYTVELDVGAAQSTSTTTVESVAALTDQDPVELDPLWEYIDPDALDAFVAHTDDTPAACRVTFSYEGHIVDVIDNRELRIAPTTDR